MRVNKHEHGHSLQQKTRTHLGCDVLELRTFNYDQGKEGHECRVSTHIYLSVPDPELGVDKANTEA